MEEDQVYVRCLKKDAHLVKAVAEEARKEFLALVEKELHKKLHSLRVDLDEHSSLDERILEDNSNVDVTKYDDINEIIPKN